MVVDFNDYLHRGCMRCKLGGTPECKVHSWKKEIELLRELVLDSGLKENIKWSVPCYTYNNQNVLILSAFKDFVALSFFKGSLLQDVNNLLEKPGKNSQASRYLKYTSSEQINNDTQIIQEYVHEAIVVEKAGLKVEFKKNPEPMPLELKDKMENDPVFRNAFESLTAGRQRGYIIHFSQPKQSKTRSARIEKWEDRILNGEGMQDAYKNKMKAKL